MTSKQSNLNYGPPPPVTKLTHEQDLKLRLTYDALCKDATRKEDIITVFMALQEQNFVLGNSMMNLLKQWPKVPPIINEELSMFGILLENKN